MPQVECGAARPAKHMPPAVESTVVTTTHGVVEMCAVTRRARAASGWVGALSSQPGLCQHHIQNIT